MNYNIIKDNKFKISKELVDDCASYLGEDPCEIDFFLKVSLEMFESYTNKSLRERTIEVFDDRTNIRAPFYPVKRIKSVTSICKNGIVKETHVNYSRVVNDTIYVPSNNNGKWKIEYETGIYDLTYSDKLNIFKLVEKLVDGYKITTDILSNLFWEHSPQYRITKTYV